MSEAVTVFFSYSHKDEALRDELAKHLTILRRQNIISDWYDRDITAGDDWKAAILDQLNQADLILLLISADFLASDFCWAVELIRAIERHDNGEAVVIPIILREVDWAGAPFGKLQALPNNAQSVMTWPTTDAAFKDVAVGIRKAVKDLQKCRTEAKRQNLNEYETTYRQAVQQQYPLQPEVQAQLDRLQITLALSAQDVAPIKTKLNRQFGEARERLDKYRQEVCHCLETNGGEITAINRPVLNAFRRTYKLTQDEAQAIEQEELAPYVTKRQNLVQYESVLQETLQQQNPLSKSTRSQMKRLQAALELCDEEVQTIEAALQQAAERQRLEREKAEAEAQLIQQGKEASERKRREAEDDLSSEKGIDYRKLRDFLKVGDWKAANRETHEVMIRAIGKKSGSWFTEQKLLNFPCEDLLTIDRLWVKYSQGKFGFSIQKQIYVECSAVLDGNYPGDKIWRKFGDKVGWRVDDDWISYNEVTFSARKAPCGHLPWVVKVQVQGYSLIFKGTYVCEYANMYLFSRMKTCGF